MSRSYDSTVARIAGNILSGYPVSTLSEEFDRRAVAKAVEMARLIVDEVKRTELPSTFLTNELATLP